MLIEKVRGTNDLDRPMEDLTSLLLHKTSRILAWGLISRAHLAASKQKGNDKT